MANIITDVSGDLRVRMANARFARAPIPSIFTGWTTLRVALLVNLADSGANITATPRFAFGLCSGATNIMGDATTTHFCGVISTETSWTRSTAPTRYNVLDFALSKKVGTTLTTGTLLTGAGTFFTGLFGLYFVDITKGSPNFSFRFFHPTGSTAPSPAVTLADFLVQSISTVPVYNVHVYDAAQTVAVSEGTDGTFDHACVLWDQSVPTMDIAAWRVYRIA